MPLPNDAVTVDLAAGTAEMHVERIEVIDGYNFGNLISGGPTGTGIVSFDVWWHTPTATEQLSDATAGFAATLLDVTSSIAFTARSGDFTFVSDPPDTSESIFARIGFEANGVYFPGAGAMPMATPTG